MNRKTNYIAGEWDSSNDWLPNINPSDISDNIGEYAVASQEQTEQAISAASHAAASWSGTGIQDRSDMLDRIGTTLLKRKEELGELLSREEGKTLPEGVAEVGRAGYIFKFFAGEALRNSGEHIASVRPGVHATITREPIGVVGIITPWNFPMAIPAWKIAPALAYGNCVVFKPAQLVPGCAHALAEIIVDSGIDSGAFNLVMGTGSITGQAIVEHPDVDGISFTGSIVTGNGIAVKAAARGAKVQLEMGGKNPLVITDDADLDTAVDCAIQGAFYSTGQRCTASSRLIVTRGIRDRFVQAVVEKLEKLTVDHALQPGTDIGPVVDEKQFQQDIDYIEIGKNEGANLVYGGVPLERATQGYYLSPALFTDTVNDMRINREEIFGPVATIIPVDDYDQALDVANDTEFGLSAGICTTSLKHASHFQANVRSGMTMVNLPTAGVDYHVPFGGRKGSNYGPREQGRHAREFYTLVKTSYVSS